MWRSPDKEQCVQSPDWKEGMECAELCIWAQREEAVSVGGELILKV